MAITSLQTDLNQKESLIHPQEMKNMNPFTKLTEEWLQRSNQEQCEWAFKYLGLDKGYYNLVLPERIYDAVAEEIQSWENSLANRVRGRAMREAWRQKKYRNSHPDKKPFTFFLAKKVSAQLKYLSNTTKKHQNEIVEELILDAVGFEKARKQEARAQALERQAKASINKPKGETVPKRDHDKLKAELAATRLKLEKLERFDDDQLAVLAEALATIELQGVNESPNPRSDRLAVEKLSALIESRDRALE